jgi:SAM-dependent methyltransferase
MRTELLNVKRRIGDVVRPERRALSRARWDLASRHLRGEGLEIGALDKPLRLPRSASARYVDHLDGAGLREHYPELEGLPLVDVEVVDDGETLATVADASVDFIVANHFMEHTQDPIGTLKHHLRVLRPGGILYLAIPDKRRTFDRPRPVTPLEHVVRDHLEGPEGSRHEHYLEWAQEVSRVLNDVPDHLVADDAATLEAAGYSIHFHVWTPLAWLRLVEWVGRTEPLDLVACAQNGHEFISVLRKDPDTGEQREPVQRLAAVG